MGMPFSTVNSQVAVVANAVQAPNGDILNLSAAWWVIREGKKIEVRYDAENVRSYTYDTEANADTDYQNFRAAMNVTAIGAPFITSITPATAVAGTTINSAIKGLNFKSTGTVKIGADACTVRFVDSFTLLVTVLGTAAASTVNVVYTDPDGVTTATLTGGYTWT